MKKLYKSLFVFFIGIILGYYLCNINLLTDIFSNTYTAFQIGVYTDYGIASAYKEKYSNAVIIKDNELYRVYAAILKENKNIESMSKYLRKNNIEFFLRDISIDDKILANELNEYERIMDNDNEIVFLEVNKLIIEKYKESL